MWVAYAQNSNSTIFMVGGHPLGERTPFKETPYMDL